MEAIEALQIVNAEVAKIPGRKTKTPNGYMICCAFHDDSSPSCSLNLNPSLMHKGKRVAVGTFYCFSCKEGRGSWNKLAERLNLRKLDGEMSENAELLVRPRNESLYSDENTLEDLMESMKLTRYKRFTGDERWRTFKASFLKKFSAYTAVHEQFGTRYLFLPVNVAGDMVGAIKARWEKRKGSLSYVNSKGGWVKGQGLFPYDEVKAMRPRCVWLVEGPRDALRLLKYGIPALCILGTNNWSEEKRDLIVALGVERVITFFDGDKAGRVCTKLVAPTFDGLLEVKTAKLWHIAKKLGLKKLDPCECPKEYLSALVKKYHLK